MKLLNIEYGGELPNRKLIVTLRGNDDCIYKASVDIPFDAGVNTLIHRLSCLSEQLWKLYFAHQANKDNWK